MIWTTDLKQLTQGDFFHKPIALTIGNFDGVHVGHQKLVKGICEWARDHQGNSLVITFHPHPMQVLFPEKEHERLFDYEDQKHCFEKLGVQAVFVQNFSKKFADLTADEFIYDFLLKQFQPKKIIVGHDFAFGAGRTGNFELLKRVCEQKGIEVEKIPPVHVGGEVVSTSAIRKALRGADLKKVHMFLNRNYYLEGIVEKGFARGRTLGVPTANLKPEVSAYPCLGVYVCKVFLQNQEFCGVANIGNNPTFMASQAAPVKAEVHILGFNQDIYGQKLKIELCEFIRGEKKFASVEDLKSQIAFDIQFARSYFKI